MKFYVKYQNIIEDAFDEFCKTLNLCNLRSQENLMVVFNNLDINTDLYKEYSGYIENYRSLDYVNGHTLAHHLHLRPNEIPLRFSDHTKKGYLNPNETNMLGIWKNEDIARDIIMQILNTKRNSIIKHFMSADKATISSDKITDGFTQVNTSCISFNDIAENTLLYTRTKTSIYCYYVDNGDKIEKEFELNSNIITSSIITDTFIYEVKIVLHYDAIINKFWLETAFPSLFII